MEAPSSGLRGTQGVRRRQSREQRGSASVRRVLAATDGSSRAARAVEWAAEMADRYGAELLVLQVLGAGNGVEPEGGEAALGEAADALSRLAQSLAGERGRARVVARRDPAEAIVEVAEEEGADVVVVGNLGMSGRREFLLGNVPNRVSHNARCTVVIVNTAERGKRGGGGLLRSAR
jgi:ubiquinone biosynthesis protein